MMLKAASGRLFSFVRAAHQTSRKPARNTYGRARRALLASPERYIFDYMGAFILRRLFQAIVVMVSVAFIAFLLFQ